ncbi:MAG TPA: MBOAT family O-acyltransferase [Blastocatellia bacterium]|nr:MBOAT family O-acyltransferase [Blastocatellia bacterium]
MLFTNGTYYVFLIAVFFAYWAVANRARWRVGLLVAAGVLFYWINAGRALALLIAISVIDFTTARLMARAAGKRQRRLLLAVSLIADIGALCFFKYANFFLESAAGAAQAVGLHATAPHLDIVAPLGISFFVFQSLAYVIDVYRKDGEPAKRYLDYLAFVAFFPTMLAGPILRARDLLQRLRERVTLDNAAGAQALFLIAVGLTKKIAIADYLSANLVERVFDFPERFSSLEVLAAVYGYALQIYADFSGYSDIALGSALLLGLRLPANFNAPYRAASLPEFWRRWHISLSTWLRDYVFFSIAGRRARNVGVLYGGLVVTMLVGGLWHGPTWTFVVWGLLHGTGLVAARAWEKARKRFSLVAGESRWPRLMAALLTFHFVCFAWIFFRAESLAAAFGVLKQLAALSLDTANLAAPVVGIIALGFASHFLPDRWWHSSQSVFARMPTAAQASLLFALAVGLYFVASSDFVPFIYSRF